jgi:hypothetical protein
MLFVEDAFQAPTCYSRFFFYKECNENAILSQLHWDTFPCNLCILQQLKMKLPINCQVRENNILPLLRTINFWVCYVL